jgi:ABC-type transporter MlaC component
MKKIFLTMCLSLLMFLGTFAQSAESTTNSSTTTSTTNNSSSSNNSDSRNIDFEKIKMDMQKLSQLVYSLFS